MLASGKDPVVVLSHAFWRFSFVRANMKLVNVLPERLAERLADPGIAAGGIASERRAGLSGVEYGAGWNREQDAKRLLD
jgi:hypothetical protein